METCNQLGGYNVQETTYFQDMLSSWFEMGDQDHINPTLPCELPTDLHLQDDNLFSSGMSNLAGTLPDVTSFLLDSQPELDTMSMLLDTLVDSHDHHESSTLHAVFPSDDEFQCAPVGSCLGNGMDSPPPAVIEATSVGSTFSSSTVTTMSWPETRPSLDVTINVSSPAMGSGEEDEGEGHTDQIGLATTPTTMNSKNLVSERNRRKRLSQQLLALRALVPNITKVKTYMTYIPNILK